jgi:nucleoside-diphosphate-sugar epimerase
MAPIVRGSVERTVLITGGAGYIGALACRELLLTGRKVRVLDCLLHGQEAIAADLEAAGVEVIRGDVRDAAAREAALRGVEEVVHLAAIVGDPACARDPETAAETNVQGSRALLAAARQAGVARLVFASTCSNYGRMADPTVPISEDGALHPVSLYAEQKVEIERLLLGGSTGSLRPTCLRFATVYGVAPRMRFDLTVNEFTRDLWADRRLEVFGEQFWRPYVHVSDAARAIRTALDAPSPVTEHAVFNVGNTGENYRKIDLVEAIQREIPRGEVTYVHRDEDPRDYKVNFDKIRADLGFATKMTVPDGIREIARALDASALGDPYDPRCRN